jgi:hypothetical protein
MMDPITIQAAMAAFSALYSRISPLLDRVDLGLPAETRMSLGSIKMLLDEVMGLPSTPANLRVEWAAVTAGVLAADDAWDKVDKAAPEPPA